GLDDAGVGRLFGDRLGVAELVEAEVQRPPCGHRHAVGADGLAIGIEDRDLDVRIAVRGVEEAGDLVTGHLRLRAMAPARDITFGDGPALTSDGFHDGRSGVRGLSGYGFAECVPRSIGAASPHSITVLISSVGWRCSAA